MKKELEGIGLKGIDDLMMYIRIHGLPLDDIEAMNKISDIIGNQTPDDLGGYLNNGQAQQLMFILKYIWTLSDVFNFYNEYSGQSEVRRLREQLEQANRHITALEAQEHALTGKLDQMKVKCTWCEAVFGEMDIVYDGATDTEYCPECGWTGYLVDVPDDTTQDH